MNTIILASRNPHKIEELQSVLSQFEIELKSALDLPDLKEVEEDRPTLEGNALKKATYVYKETGLPALADDTGLEVDALGGRPGVYSARYAGENANYKDNVEKLLQELSVTPAKNWTARFRTVIAFVTDERPITFEGVCEGQILASPRGNRGFGYDPVFQPVGYDKTFAELDLQEKNKISHRGRALSMFLAHIRAHSVD
jgi:XTP/dITP diphosphohydrolase